MAILRGFPPSNTISPSVRITEKDLSYIAPDQSFHRAGLVGFCSKGPINIPTVVRSTRELNTVFGYPHPDVSDPYLIYAAQQYLLVANELYVVRVADEDMVSDERAATAEVAIPVAGSRIYLQSNVSTTSFSVPEDTFFRWKINGVLSSKVLTLPNDADTFVFSNGTSKAAGTFTPGTYTLQQLLDYLNSQLDSATQNATTLAWTGNSDGFDGIYFSGGEDIAGYVSTKKLTLETTFTYGPAATLELVSVHCYTNGGTPVSLYGGAGAILGLGVGMTRAYVIGSKDRYPNVSTTTIDTWDFTLLDDAERVLQIVVDGTGSTAIDNIVQEIPFTSQNTWTTTQIVNQINGLITAGTIPGGFIASAYGTYIEISTTHFGRDARLLVKSNGLYSIFGFSTTTKLGETPEGTMGVDADTSVGLVYGGTVASTYTFTMTAESAGLDGSNTKVRIKNDLSNNTFQFDVYNNGVQVESWGGLTKTTSSRYYVETFLSLVSDYIRVTDNTATAAPPEPNDDTDNPYYELLGGRDGIPSNAEDQDTLLIGSNVGFTGMYALSEPEQIDIDLIAVPGHSSTDIVMALIDLCQNYRMDCLAIIDPPFGLTVKEITAWQNGTHPYNTTRFDSDFAALYWPWVKLHDTFNNVDVWVPPSGSVMATIALSDNLAAPWYAPAGLTRGIVPGITDVFTRPTLEERDLMYGNRNAINPIVQFSDATSYVIWGQKTLQRNPTALDRVNVRRLMFVCEKRIRAKARELLFEPHDDILRHQFVNIATDILREIQVGRGINDFIIKCDTELNTPDVIDRNELRARIGIQPIRAAEFIFIEFSIHRTGSFTENADTF